MCAFRSSLSIKCRPWNNKMLMALDYVGVNMNIRMIGSNRSCSEPLFGFIQTLSTRNFPSFRLIEPRCNGHMKFLTVYCISRLAEGITIWCPAEKTMNTFEYLIAPKAFPISTLSRKIDSFSFAFSFKTRRPPSKFLRRCNFMTGLHRTRNKRYFWHRESIICSWHFVDWLAFRCRCVRRRN